MNIDWHKEALQEAKNRPIYVELGERSTMHEPQDRKIILAMLFVAILATRTRENTFREISYLVKDFIETVDGTIITRSPQ